MPPDGGDNKKKEKKNESKETDGRSFGIGAGFHLYVNGKKIAAAWDQVSGEAAVRAGFNHIKIITQTTQPVQLFMKVSGSVKEPNVLSPGRMFYDDNPNEDDDIL